MEEKRERENVDTSGPNISNLIPLMLTNPSTSLANLKGSSYEVVNTKDKMKKDFTFNANVIKYDKIGLLIIERGNFSFISITPSLDCS